MSSSTLAIAEITGDNITIKGKEYLGTPGLWELLIMKEPDKNICTDAYRADYAEILGKKLVQ